MIIVLSFFTKFSPSLKYAYHENTDRINCTFSCVLFSTSLEILSSIWKQKLVKTFDLSNTTSEIDLI